MCMTVPRVPGNPQDTGFRGEKWAGEKGKGLTCRKVRSSEPNKDAAMSSAPPANRCCVTAPEKVGCGAGPVAKRAGPGQDLAYKEAGARYGICALTVFHGTRENHPVGPPAPEEVVQ